ncbi:MAG: hypothetical protein WDW36_009125 [Sanguina aurantia]
MLAQESIKMAVTVTTPGSAPINIDILSIAAASDGTDSDGYDNIVTSGGFPYVSPSGFVFTGGDGNEYNVHSDGMGGLQLGNPFTNQTSEEDDTYITSYYAQYNDDSATAPALDEIGCFGDYQVGIPGHARASPGDGWTARRYPGSAFPRATVDDAMTADLCGFVAMAHGFSLFGVANGRECWYGNDDAQNAERLGEVNSCMFPCYGNSEEMCGAAGGGIIVWSIPPSCCLSVG